MTPLDSYAFSGESSLQNPGEPRTRRNSYHVHSEYLPPQTTVLGTLRRCLLEWGKLFREDKAYDRAAKEEMAKLIGAEPFRFTASEFNLGAIKGISCVFLTHTHDDGKKSWLFPVPRNTSQDEKILTYQPMSWDRDGFVRHQVSLNGFDVKKSLSEAYVSVPFSSEGELPAGGVEQFFANNLKTGNLVPSKNIFISSLQSAIRKVEDDVQKGYRIHERIMFKRENGQYAFAIVADIADGILSAPAPLIVSMGARGSLFRVQATVLKQVQGCTNNKANRSFPEKGCCIAALSPLSLPANWRDMVSFAILNKRKIRQMMPCSTGADAYRHDETLRFFAAPGSVLYLPQEKAKAFLEQLEQNQNLYKAGFNHVMFLDEEVFA